jgi:hypothetical protein
LISSCKLALFQDGKPSLVNEALFQDGKPSHLISRALMNIPLPIFSLTHRYGVRIAFRLSFSLLISSEKKKGENN